MNMSVSCNGAVCDVHYHSAILLNPLGLSSRDFKAFLIMIKELLSHLSTGLCLISCNLMTCWEEMRVLIDSDRHQV